MNLDKAREAFTHDPQYRNLVELLVHQIESLQMSPSEIREVAMFACLIVEERRIYPLPCYTSEQYKKFVLGEWNVFDMKEHPVEVKLPICRKCQEPIRPGGDGLCDRCRVEANVDACQEVETEENQS